MRFSRILSYTRMIAFGPLAPFETRRGNVSYALEFLRAALICKITDHTFEVSQHDAESGYEQLTCSRCFESFDCYHN